MTSITDREPDDRGALLVNDRTTFSLPVVLAVLSGLLAGIFWANSLNIAVAEVKKDQSNDRERLQRIEASVERVEGKLDSIKDNLRAQPQPRSPETDYGVPRRFDR